MAGINRLTNTQVKNATTGKLNDGGGLWLVTRKGGGSQWIYRFSFLGKRPEMGLGAYPETSLAHARAFAEKWRGVLASGINPIAEREREKKRKAKTAQTLNEITVEAFEAHKLTLVDNGAAGKWLSPVQLHILPALGKMPVNEIDQIDIKQTLAPIWRKKPVTARKALNRLRHMIRFAAAAGLNVDIQATEKAKLLLGAQGDKPKHIPSMDWRDVPAFYNSLNDNSPCQLALRLLILTGLRSRPIRFMHIDHIQDDVLTVPAELMKGQRDRKRAFRVPLSQEAQRVIDKAMLFERDGFLFPNVNKGVLSDASMGRFMQRSGLEARPHGFRSSFRTWVQETNAAPYDVAETALAHNVGSVIERTYAHSDLLEPRRVLMDAWANRILDLEAGIIVSDNVVPIRMQGE